LAVQGELAVPPPVVDRDQAIARAVDRRPDVVAARAEAAMAAARIMKEQTEGRWDASVSVGYQRQDFGFDLRGVTDSGATRPIRDVFHYFGAACQSRFRFATGTRGTSPRRRRKLAPLSAGTSSPS
jgi:hypothetical protein